MATKNTKAKAPKIEEILSLIKKSAAKDNYFFMTTFERYQVQLQIMGELKKNIDEEGVVTTKEYVKDRKNLYANPAVTEYNKTATAANGTVATLINVLKSMPVDEEGSKLKDMFEELA